MGSDAGFEGCAGYGGLISIHSPRMGIDVRCLLTRTGKHYFNPRSPDGERRPQPEVASATSTISIHAPRMGSDGVARDTLRDGIGFQSTLPGWGATLTVQIDGAIMVDFNPRSPDGERRPQAVEAHERVPISIHAPRMGSDRENGHLRPRYGQNHPFSTLIVSQIVVDVLGTVRKSQKTPAH